MRCYEKNSFRYISVPMSCHRFYVCYRHRNFKKILPEPQLINYIFDHLDYDGVYQNPWLNDADMFCKRIASAEMPGYNKDYTECSEFEMRIVFDLDQNFFMMENNPNCLWYRIIGSFSCAQWAHVLTGESRVFCKLSLAC